MWEAHTARWARGRAVSFFNLAKRAEHDQIKRQLARHIPRDEGLKQFVRWGRWKCVFPVAGEPMLFDYQGEFGISEQNDLAAQHPDVIAAVQKFVAENNITARRINMPAPSDGTTTRKTR